MCYKIAVASRKLVVERIKKITGEKTKYTKMPRCAYFSHEIILEKDNRVALEANADLHLIAQLVEEGYLVDTEEIKSFLSVMLLLG